MKIIFYIAKVQLARFFYSPIAWLVLMIILVQTGYRFTDIIDFFEIQQRQGQPWPVLTNYLFAVSGGSRSGILYSILQNLYLYLPLLTMVLVSPELSSGTIKLLYSAPVKTHQLVIGKYIAMLIIIGMIIVGMSTFIISGSFFIKDIDYGLTTAGLLGVFLLASAYSAIGLFISCLSPYQIVVALITFSVLTALNFVGSLWQSVPFLNEITFWLSMSDRANSFVKGLVKSSNVVYFLVVTAFFLSITILRFRFAQQSTTALKQFAMYSLVIATSFIIGYISSVPSLRFYIDMTSTDRLSISKNTQQIIHEMGSEPLTMSVYANILDKNVHSSLPNNRNSDIREFEDYQRFKPNMEFEYIYFYDTIYNRGLFTNNAGLSLKELAQKVAATYGLDFDRILNPIEIRKMVDLSDEGNQYVRQLKYKDRVTFLRMFDGMDHYPGESEISAALKRLTSQPFQILFSSGHGERTFLSNKDEDYTTTFALRYKKKGSLRNYGFDLKEASLRSGELQTENTILVIADPKLPFNSNEISKIEEYIDRGGDMFLSIEPDNSDVLAPILKKLGISQIPGELVATDNEAYDKNLILAKYAGDNDMVPNFFINIALVKYGYPITMPSASGWEYGEVDNDFSISPFIVGHNVKSNGDDSTRTNVPIVLTITRETNDKIQRIVVAGDADFISNKEVSRSNITNVNDRGLTPFLFHWLSNGAFPVDVEVPPGTDNRLFLAEKEGKTIKILQIIHIGVIPGLLLLMGTFVLISRRRK